MAKSVIISILLFLWVNTTFAGNHYRLLDTEKDALQCRADLLCQAKKEVLTAVYIMREDDIGLGILQLMVDAAERGCKTRLILDGFGSKLSRSLLRYLVNQGIEIRTFHRLRLHQPQTWNYRMHGKMLMTDEENLIVGGRNLADEYYNLKPESNFLDLEVYAQSADAVAKLRYHFYEMWNNSKVTEGEKKSRQTEEEHQYWKAALRNALQNLIANGGLLPCDSSRQWATPDNATNASIGVVNDGFVKRHGDRIWLDKYKNKQSTRQLLNIVKTAKSQILIENPYFHPTPRWKRAFKSAIARGVQVKLLTNSECTNDLPLMQSVYKMVRKKYLKMGIEIWEYVGDKQLHTKSFVIDSAISIVGSYNLHISSEKNNTEVCVWLADSTIAARQLKWAASNFSKAVKVEVPCQNSSKLSNSGDMKCRSTVRKVNVLRYIAAPFVQWLM